MQTVGSSQLPGRGPILVDKWPRTSITIWRGVYGLPVAIQGYRGALASRTYVTCAYVLMHLESTPPESIRIMDLILRWRNSIQALRKGSPLVRLLGFEVVDHALKV